MAHKETKFRAWDKNRQWLGQVVSIDFDKQLVGFEHENAIWFAGFEDVELLEYIGIRDRHNKKIYEGDIIAWMRDPRSGILDCKMVVEIRVGELGVLQSVPAINNTSEIIGNCFENPELLKETSKVA